jgi:hypothetical protein
MLEQHDENKMTVKCCDWLMLPSIQTTILYLTSIFTLTFFSYLPARAKYCQTKAGGVLGEDQPATEYSGIMNPLRQKLLQTTRKIQMQI